MCVHLCVSLCLWVYVPVYVCASVYVGSFLSTYVCICLCVWESMSVSMCLYVCVVFVHLGVCVVCECISISVCVCVLLLKWCKPIIIREHSELSACELNWVIRRLSLPSGLGLENELQIAPLKVFDCQNVSHWAARPQEGKFRLFPEWYPDRVEYYMFSSQMLLLSH